MSLPFKSGQFRIANGSLQHYVDADILPGACASVLYGGEVVDEFTCGWADKERGIMLRPDHIFRSFSNTKLVTTIAILLLWQDGQLKLDDPVGDYLPQLVRLPVLRAGATRIDDTEPAQSPITIRQLLSHSSGLAYGLFDSGTPLFDAYIDRGVLNPMTSLAHLVECLSTLPLSFQPGTNWEYSVATDVLARLVEIVTGSRFDDFLDARIFRPLGMVDTGFFVPLGKHARLVRYYGGADAYDPLKPGLTPLYAAPYLGAFLSGVPRLSGGGGLVSTRADMLALVRSLLPGAKSLLHPDSIALIMGNQLSDGVRIRLPNRGDLSGKAFTAAGALTVMAVAGEHKDMVGEVQWGGIGGTHWWIAPRANVAGVLMAQRHMSFWHPFWFEYKYKVHEACRSMKLR